MTPNDTRLNDRAAGSPTFTCEAPLPVATLSTEGLRILVYKDDADMGLASAISLAAEQCRLVAARGTASLMLMAAPSAFAFYRAYIRLAESCPDLQNAIHATHFFQFDDYCLPLQHPASFRFLLCKRFFFPLAHMYDAQKVHLFSAEAPNVEEVAASYGRLILEHGPDLQLKGIGENGHWGFHEPGVPITGEPRFGQVSLTEENVAQQMRDHPRIFADRESVPRHAYTANVPLFMKTRERIEDNVPQPSKAFALLAAYGSESIDPCVPSSMLKSHPHAVVRTTTAAAWALMKYRATGAVSHNTLCQLADSISGAGADKAKTAERMRAVLRSMQIACD